MTQEPTQLIAVLEAELGTLTQKLDLLTARKTGISNLLELLRSQDGGETLGPIPVAKLTSIAPKPASEPEAPLYIPQPTTPAALTEGAPPNQNEQPNTLSMARQILRNARGRALTLPEIVDGIRSTYKVEPAKTIDQMLWRRAAQEKGFYKTEDGKFGLTELKVQVDRVLADSSATA